MPWLADHPVAGQTVVPAAAWVEMALAAGSQALGRPAESIAVTGLQIEQPLVLDGAVQVTTQLSGTDAQPRVEIHARATGEAWSRYAIADIAPAPSDQAAPAPSDAGVLTLPDHVTGHPAYQLHPVLLDAALHQLTAMIPAEQSDGVGYAPAAVAGVRVFGRVGRQVRCHTEVTDSDGTPVGRVVLTDLSDEAGTTLAELTGVELR